MTPCPWSIMPVNVDKQWDEILQPCKQAGCTAEVLLWQDDFQFSTFAQHGSNPEHRKQFDAQCIADAGGWSLVPHIRAWLERVHAPAVWETV